MVVPHFETLMLPMLQYAADRREYSFRETIEYLGNKFGLSEAERSELLPSGRMLLFDNRVGWTLFYLKKAGLLEGTRRGFYRITQEGLDALYKLDANEIDTSYLKRFPLFQAFLNLKVEPAIDAQEIAPAHAQSPDELLEYSYQRFRQILAADLVSSVKNCSPHFFERLVIDLLVRMGYGGSIKEASEVIGRSGDEGIDGTIKEDALGLDVIYIQAKKWDGSVGRPEIQKFAGALQGQGARKGIFLTTGSFSKEAREFSSRINTKIVLVDGVELVDLMIDHNVGVSPLRSYTIKKVDTDYFDETT